MNIATRCAGWLLLPVLVAALTMNGCSSDPSIEKQGGAAPVGHMAYGSEMRDFQVSPPTQIEWKPGPGSLPPGAQMAVIEGDPTEEGPFVFRVKLPAGYTIPPHTHPRAERVTVIQGTFNVAEGDRIDKTTGSGKAKVMSTGSFGYWPARMHHFAWASEDTIIQLHGLGPWSIQYLNPQDDPGNAKH